MQKNGNGWIGRIREVPEVNCEQNTQDALLKALKNELHAVLIARADAWDKEIEADIKAGRLDLLSDKALEDLRAGRGKDLFSVIKNKTQVS